MDLGEKVGGGGGYVGGMERGDTKLQPGDNV